MFWCDYIQAFEIYQTIIYSFHPPIRGGLNEPKNNQNKSWNLIGPNVFFVPIRFKHLFLLFTGSLRPALTHEFVENI